VTGHGGTTAISSENDFISFGIRLDPEFFYFMKFLKIFFGVKELRNVW
jgi:hypothetical protein